MICISSNKCLNTLFDMTSDLMVELRFCFMKYECEVKFPINTKPAKQKFNCLIETGTEFLFVILGFLKKKFFVVQHRCQFPIINFCFGFIFTILFF